MKQFNIRQLLAVTAMSSIIVAIFRRPLRWLIEQGDTSSGCLGQFVDGYRHLAWLAGFEIEYAKEAAGFSSSETLAALAGFVTSAILHVGMIFGIGYGFCCLWRWASETPEDSEA